MPRICLISRGVSMRSIRKAACVAVCPLVAAFLVVPFLGSARTPQRPDYNTLFNKTEVMIPMRDGVKLHTEFYTPKNATTSLPILMNRTPYGISSPGKGVSNMIYRYADMVPDGYIFVFQDIRGRYGSEGKFVMLRPLHDPSDAKGVDESTDTYDTIDWLAKHVPNNNGRVGLDGISYDGFLVTMGMINPHPALKAASEQACMGDTWLGDDFFHNGAFRLSYAFEYTALLEPSARLGALLCGPLGGDPLAGTQPGRALRAYGWPALASGMLLAGQAIFLPGLHAWGITPVL